MQEKIKTACTSSFLALEMTQIDATCCRDEASNSSLKVELSVARGVLALDEPTSGELPSSCIVMSCG